MRRGNKHGHLERFPNKVHVYSYIAYTGCNSFCMGSFFGPQYVLFTYMTPFGFVQSLEQYLPFKFHTGFSRKLGVPCWEPHQYGLLYILAYLGVSFFCGKYDKVEAQEQ